MDMSKRDPALQCIFYVTVLFASVPCLADIYQNHSQPESTSTTATSLFLSSLHSGSFTQNAKQLISQQQPPSFTLHTTTASPALRSLLRKSTDPVESCSSEKLCNSSKPEFGNRTFPSSLNASNFLGDLENVTEFHQGNVTEFHQENVTEFHQENVTEFHQGNVTKFHQENVTEFHQESNSTGVRDQETRNVTRSVEQLWPGRRQREQRVRANGGDSASRSLKRKISLRVSNQSSSLLNGSQSEREPAELNSTSRPSKVNEKKFDDQLAFNSYLEVEGYGDNTNYDDDQGYPDQGFGSDEYGMFGNGVEKRRNDDDDDDGPDPFRDYEELQDEPFLVYNYTNPLLTKGKESWSTNNRRIEYDGLYDLHLMQEIPDGSSVIRRIVSLSGRLSSERINVSLIVIYGWLGLVILMIVTALVVVKYKQKLSIVCSRVSTTCRLTSVCCHRGIPGFEEGNNLLAHPLV